ncbi:MAG: hypothetical protein KDD43_08260 [Bdellovibrionales bacterium]|nr:hypothetical protein [Bdellovibrionales bacterium]
MFDDAVLIYAYTRNQAIEDGVLVDVTETAKEAGYRVPVAITNSVYVDCVQWTEEDQEKTYQDESGRLWDVLFMSGIKCRALTRTGIHGDSFTFQFRCIPREGTSTEPELVTLVCRMGGGDHGEPVMTIMFPHED